MVKLKQIMKERGLSQTEVAKLSGVSQPTISLYLKGDRGLSLKTAIKISQALGVSPEDLLPEDVKTKQ